MSEYADRTWSSRDGMTLHYRDYPGREDRPPLLCLPGLTRNARDFANLADRLAGEWRVLCPEMRGRGDSDYAKDAATYNPVQYVEDVAELLAQAGIDRFVAIGTSLGGLMTMLMAQAKSGAIAGALINDIGPVIEQPGLDRIRSYVGLGRNFPTWMHAARAIEETQGVAFPDYDIAEWLAAAKRVMTLTSNGRIVFDYDMKLAEPFADTAVPDPEMLWPGIEALAGRPVLFVRGALSDLFSQATLDEMVRRVPGAEAVTIDRVGHAPTLDEPGAVDAIARLLSRVG